MKNDPKRQRDFWDFVPSGDDFLLFFLPIIDDEERRRQKELEEAALYKELEEDFGLDDE
jgi:hypothetical protein